MIPMLEEKTWIATVRATASVMKEIAVIAIETHAVVAGVAFIIGWGNPFSNNEDPIALQGFIVSVAALGSFIGTLIMCPLIPLMLHKPSSRAGEPISKTRTHSVWANAWIVMRHSVVTLLMSSLVPGAATMLLLWVGAPVVRYNTHTLFMCMAVNICAVMMASKYRHFCRLQTAAQQAVARLPVSSVLPEPVESVVAAKPVATHRSPSRHSWKSSALRALRISTPSTVTAMVAIQYITISRRVPFDSVNQFVVFAVTSSILKTLLPVLVKFYIAKTGIRDARNTFFMMSAPLFHIEIQLRMAMLKAQSTTPLFVTSGFVNVAELAARAAALAFDLALVRRAEKRLAKKKLRLQALRQSTGNDGVQTRLLQLDENHTKWKKAHYRVCAAETIAGMAAEYCGIGLMTIFSLVLNTNASIDIPRPPQTSTIGLYQYQTQAWATQVAFEMVTDVVATMGEIRLGIPVMELIKSDGDSFIRWSIGIIVAQASGTCLASFIIYS